MAEPERDPASVEAMFDRIAGRYDLVNALISFNSDARWRRHTARAASPAGSLPILDIACGSGRLAVALRRRSAGEAEVVGVDFSARMLEVAARRASGPRYVRGDALRLPFDDATFQAATMAFGLRNLADPEAGLREMLRVLVPGGRAVVLEFLRPASSPVGGAYRLYLRHVLPLIGGAISGQPAAYRYLSATVDAYQTPAQLRELAQRAGWGDVALRRLTLGTVGILSGRRQGGDHEP